MNILYIYIYTNIIIYDKISYKYNCTISMSTKHLLSTQSLLAYTEKDDTQRLFYFNRSAVPR